MPQMSKDAVRFLIAKLAREKGIDPKSALAIAKIESSFDAGSNFNKPTQYKGLYQIGKDEWNKYGKGRDIYDPTANTKSFFDMYMDNKSALEKSLGRAASPGELYLAHQQGIAGATALLNNPDKNAIDIMTKYHGPRARKVILGNGGTADMTGSDFANMWINKHDRFAKQFENFWPRTEVAEAQPTILGTQSTPAVTPNAQPTILGTQSTPSMNTPAQMTSLAPVYGTQSTPAMPRPMQAANAATTAGGAQYGPPKSDFQKFQVGKAQGSLMNGIGLLAAGMQQAQPIQMLPAAAHRPDPRWQGFQFGLLG